MPPTITPYLLYEDVDASARLPARAFGFEEILRYTGPEGYVNHAEMRLGDDGSSTSATPATTTATRPTSARARS